MKRNAFQKVLITSLALMAVGLGGVAQAQGPVIKLLVGFPPGGASDNLARLIADKLRERLNQPVIVENRPGVGGRVAAQAVKAAAPGSQTT